MGYQHTAQQHAIQRPSTGGAAIRGEGDLRHLLTDLEEQRDDGLVDLLETYKKQQLHPCLEDVYII